jgi:hypothetical protein
MWLHDFQFVETGVVLPPIGGLGTSLNPALPVGVDGSLHSGMVRNFVCGLDYRIDSLSSL